MSDSDSADFGNKSVDSIENEDTKKINTDKKNENPNVQQMSQMLNNNNINNQDSDFEIVNNDSKDDSNKKSENDSGIEINNNNNNFEIKEVEDKKVFDLNNDKINFPLFHSEKRKEAIILEIDEEKTKRNGFTVYQLNEIKQDSNSYNPQKKILCYRRYKEFDIFYNKLKCRFPHCIFPRLSQKQYLKNAEQIFLENRKKELQYFINRLYYHEEISKSEEFKRFINSTFDAQYFENLPNKYYYPESEKANKDQGYFSLGMKTLKGLFTNTKEHTQSDKEKQILDRVEEFKNKSIRYNELLKDIKNLYDNSEETKTEYKLISNNMLFLKDDKNKEDNDDEDIKNNFNELIDLNKKLSEVYENNVKNDLLEIIDQLNYCILEVEGINRAFERFNAFIKDYEKVKNVKADNKYVSEEKSKIEHDKEDFEESILKDLKKYDRENEFIYEQIIEKLIFYIKKVNEDGLKAFNDTNFN